MRALSFSSSRTFLRGSFPISCNINKNRWPQIPRKVQKPTDACVDHHTNHFVGVTVNHLNSPGAKFWNTPPVACGRLLSAIRRDGGVARNRIVVFYSVQRVLRLRLVRKEIRSSDVVTGWLADLRIGRNCWNSFPYTRKVAIKSSLDLDKTREEVVKCSKQISNQDFRSAQVGWQASLFQQTSAPPTKPEKLLQLNFRSKPPCSKPSNEGGVRRTATSGHSFAHTQCATHAFGY